MTIVNISITNIKGIQSKTFDLGITPNKPSLLVAPNGFGKSSIATAFASLLNNRINLSDDDFYMGNTDNNPEITIKYKNNNGIETLIANKTINSISDKFSYAVLNSQIKAKGTSRRISGQTIVTASLDVEPVTLIETVPEQTEVNYSFASQKADFGTNGKVLPNISSLVKNYTLIEKISKKYSELDSILLTKNQKKINLFRERINSQSGTKQQIIDWITHNLLQSLNSIEPLRQISEIIIESEQTYSSTLSFLAAMQLVKIYAVDKVQFKKACKYNAYKIEKAEYETLLNAVNTTWKDIKPEVKGRSLVVTFPKANHVSNGQRDILSFVSLIIRARKKLTKDRCILIIDELFDYLDDANLVSAQYFITQLISNFKSSGKELYPLILTHINPRYFQSYAFSKQKIYYLDKRDGSCMNPHFIKLLQKREENSIKDDVSKYLLHFHTESINKRNEFVNLGLKPTWGEGQSFKEFVNTEIEKYLGGQSDYDPFAVCCGVRVKIENIIYFLLPTLEAKSEFLEVHGTKSKLEFSEECGVNVPEHYYLLGIIYNDGMHWKSYQDNVSPIASKLENITIRNLITGVFESSC